MEKLQCLADQFGEAAQKYDETSATFMPGDEDIASKRKPREEKTVSKIILYEVRNN